MTGVRGPRSISVKQAVDPLLHAAVAARGRPAGRRHLRREERGRAGRALRSDRGRGMVSDRRAGAQRPAQGRLSPAARRCRAWSRDPSRRGRPAHRLERPGRDGDPGERREDRGRSRGDHRAASVCCAPACRRSIRCRPRTSRLAIGRLGYGAGVLGKIYLRFPAPLLARSAEMVRPPARLARPARHLQHLGEPRAGDRPADPAELRQRRDRGAPRPDGER